MHIPQTKEVIYITLPNNLASNAQQQIRNHYTQLFSEKSIQFRFAEQHSNAQTCQPQNGCPLPRSRPVVRTQNYSSYRQARTLQNFFDRKTPSRKTEQCQNEKNKPQHPSQCEQLKKSQLLPIRGNSRSFSPFNNSPKRYQTMQLKLRYPDGTFYKGEGRWPNIREGQGILFNKLQNQIYEGQWKNGKKNGCGVQVNYDADLNQDRFDYTDFTKLGERWLSYEGEFSDDLWHGQGFLQIANGESIVGNFKKGLINSPAIFTTNDSFDVNGIWKDGIWQDL